MRRRFLTLLACAALAVALPGCSRNDVEPGAGATAPASPRPAVAGIPPQHAERVVELFNRGIGLMERFEPVEAVKAFEEMVGLAPDWALGRLNYGIALLNAQTDEYYARAEVELKRVIAAAPDDPYAHYAFGMLLRHLTRFDEAKAQFDEVLRIDPEDADAHYQVGIIVIDKDPAAARTHLEKTIEKIPHHESACYRLQALLMKAGEKDRAQELMARFRALKAAKAGAFSGMKYSEMGRYAEVVRAFPGLAGGGEPEAAPAFTEVGEARGLGLGTMASPGWPGASLTGGAAAFAPGAAADDVDGDGDLDLYVVAVGPSAGFGQLYRNDGGRFTEGADSGIDGRGAIGAYFGDYDGDGDPDLYLTRAGANRLYKNGDDGRFTDATGESRTAGGDVVSAGAAWADADHDGDLDLYIANVARSGAGAPGAPNALFRNNGDGTFAETAKEAGIDGGEAATIGVLFFDLDDDRDLDLMLLNSGSPNRVFLNDRVGRYTDATPRFADLAGAGAAVGALTGDVDLNGREDVLVLRGAEPPRLFLQVERGRFTEDQAFATLAKGVGGAANAVLGDFDLDGDLDLVLLGSGSATVRHRVLMNNGTGAFAPPVPFGEERPLPNARGVVAADFNGDGGLDLLVARAGARPELWQVPPAPGRHWLQVIPAKGGEGEARWADPTAVGLQIEVKTGRRLQVASVKGSAGYLGGTARQAHFGLGEYGKADYVRLVWPDAVLQSELEVAADQNWRVPKVARKPSSCPLLFAWDGSGFAFVADFLGVGGLGFFIAPGEYAPPDPTEDVRIPPEAIQPRDGRYLLRIAEPLEEITYLDELHLHAYDHPASWEVYPDERFTGSPPFPTGRPLAVARKIFPKGAHTEQGADVRARILAVDRRYVEPPMDRRFIGYADDHWIELDFGDQLRRVAPDARLVLYLHSWIEYTYSHVNYAASQAGLRMQSPWIEVPDGRGGWRVAMAEAGYPGGLPRMMTVDISSLPVRTDGRLRIRTNMEVYWDQIFAAVDVSGPELQSHILRPDVADLRYLGYPREYSPDGANPTLYDYQRVDQGVPFKNLTGNYTRLGDVRPLLEAADDQFVIFARGEEIALEFDAAGLPTLPATRARTVVLHADGYCKDMDLYTAFPDTVDPLPYHAMENYPPAQPIPRTHEHTRYAETWNTRRVVGQ